MVTDLKGKEKGNAILVTGHKNPKGLSWYQAPILGL
jgi:hypothetical protein